MRCSSCLQFFGANKKFSQTSLRNYLNATVAICVPIRTAGAHPDQGTHLRALVGVEILVVSLSELETRTLLQNKIDQFLLHILSCVG